MSLPIRYQTCYRCQAQALPNTSACQSCGQVFQYCAAPNCPTPMLFPQGHPEHRDTFSMSRPGHLIVGGKSGQLVHVPVGEDKEIVHAMCILDFLKPENHKDVYDAFYDKLVGQVKTEIYEDVRQEVEGEMEEYIEGRIAEEVNAISAGKMCNNCKEEIEEEDRQANRQAPPPPAFYPQPYSTSVAPYQPPAPPPAAPGQYYYDPNRRR